MLTDEEINSILDVYDSDKPYEIKFNRKHRKHQKRIIEDGKISKGKITELVWDRLKPYIDELTVIEGNMKWVPYKCVDKMKLVKYHPGDSFSWHVDASTKINNNQKTTFSVTIYLNSVPKKCKGSTLFVDNAKLDPIQPTKGYAMLLNTLYGPEHCGEELKHGVKYILRLDVLANKTE